MSKVSAIFDSHAEAESAVTDLRTLGIGDQDMSVIAHHKGTTTASTADGEVTDEDHTNVLRGILGGGALGAGLGVAALAIPGVGPLVAAGATGACAVGASSTASTTPAPSDIGIRPEGVGMPPRQTM